ncbi:electron transfer flavoprotein subunit beta [Oleomonas cavernae]|uniref:Electron transfer flavoprotein subunit beta n=1 Tax=Oleomonas cavernae TaxID=2320859 RepID=A0A418WG08_9PROT|nr:electron transfer flavoprotein subunit beta [Oleomonas cavernae]RJF88965.1 electron transfer flavoprotein subunit beta [Oleomonas cavernae]
MKIAVLLSLGHHPVSGRACAARGDAQAIALAHSLGGEVMGLHAGPGDAAIGDYLGHGLTRLTVLEQPAGADPVPALAKALAELRPDLILAGRQAQGGDDTGLVPYLLAERLTRPIVADAAAITRVGGNVVVEQALPRGARRRVTLPLPALVTVHPAAPPALPFTHGALRRGTILRRPGEAPTAIAEPIEERPYRRRPRLMGGVAGGSAADRLKAATEVTGGGGRLLVEPDPAAAAREILDFLKRVGVRRG